MLKLGERAFPHAWCFLFVLLIGIAVGNLIFVDENLLYSIWADRDFYRAADLFRNFQFFGAELSDGGRTPGGGYYYYLALMMLFSKQPFFIYYCNLALTLIVYFFLTKSIIKHFGLWAGLGTVLLLLSSYSLTQVSLHLWNPAFVTAFIGGAYFFYLKVVCENKAVFLPAIGLILGFSSQIHLSGAFLLLAFCLALPLSGIRISWKIWFATFGAALATYAPVIIAELFNGFEELNRIGGYSAFSKELIEEYPDFTQRTKVFVQHVFYAFFSPYNRNVFTPGTELVKTLIVLGVTSVFIMPFVIAIPVILKKRTGQAAEAFKAAKPFVFTVLIGVVAMALYTHHPNTRNLMSLSPAVAIICGIGLQVLIEKLNGFDNRLIGRIGTGILTLWLSGFVLFSTVYMSHIQPFNNEYTLSYKNIRTIIKVGYEEYGLGQKELNSKVAVLTDRNRGSWQSISQRYTAIDYLLDISDLPVNGKNQQDCLLVLRHQAGTDALSEEQINKALESLPLKPDEIDYERIQRTGGFTFLPYRFKNAPCLKTFTDGYHLLEQEKELLELLKGASHEDVIKDRNSYAFMIDVASHPETLITVNKTGRNIYSFTINGHYYRGFTGLRRVSLVNPAIRLTSKSGKVYNIPFLNGTFGGMHNTVSPPWTTRSQKISNKGSYKLEFLAEDIIIENVSLGKVRQILDKNFEAGN